MDAHSILPASSSRSPSARLQANSCQLCFICCRGYDDLGGIGRSRELVAEKTACPGSIRLDHSTQPNPSPPSPILIFMVRLTSLTDLARLTNHNTTQGHPHYSRSLETGILKLIYADLAFSLRSQTTSPQKRLRISSRLGKLQFTLDLALSLWMTR